MEEHRYYIEQGSVGATGAEDQACANGRGLRSIHRLWHLFNVDLCRNGLQPTSSKKSEALRSQWEEGDMSDANYRGFFGGRGEQLTHGREKANNNKN